MNWLSNRCRQNRQSISLLASGVLPESERAGIERHLRDCGDCRRRFEKIRRLTGSLAELRESTATIEPSPAARLRWARAVRAASQPEPAVRSGRQPSPAPWWHELFLLRGHAWGGIAALWLLMWAVNWGCPSRSGKAGETSRVKPVITQTFADEQRLLAELIPHAEPGAMNASRRKPSPRSEQQRLWSIG